MFSLCRNPNISFMNCSRVSRLETANKKAENGLNKSTKENNALLLHKKKAAEKSLIACMSMTASADFFKS